MKLTAIGLMSGSSMDGIDGAIIETDGKTFANHIRGFSLSYEEEFRFLLRGLEAFAQRSFGVFEESDIGFEDFVLDFINASNYSKSIEELKDFLGVPLFEKIVPSSVVGKLTYLHAEVIENLLRISGLKPHQIDVVGFHGQNLYHNPLARITVQVGDGQLLADLTDISVVNDFRSNDVKKGGQGAPFAPLYHQVLAYQRSLFPLGIINCGGIANITIINGPLSDQLIGYDTGPGNILIDQFIRLRTSNKEFMDEDGKHGLKGSVDEGVLSILKEKCLVKYGENFFNKLPPKSLDASHFTLPSELNDLRFEDACTTLEAFTALSIVESLDLIEGVDIPRTWILAGGGWKNPVIHKYLLHYFNQKYAGEVEIKLAEEVGLKGQFIEAEIFAYLAVRTLSKLPISYPNTTNVSEPTLGGRIYSPSSTE
jgi:anhydro-N-acetylmuramic acid kinase